MALLLHVQYTGGKRVGVVLLRKVQGIAGFAR